ncbi:MAG: helix-turn-helix transcriptional regulator [Alphaproteobacteria bacterium]
MIRWTQRDLAEAAGISLETVKRLELMSGPLSGNVSTMQGLERALQDAGVEFIAENGGGPGVRLRKGDAA